MSKSLSIHLFKDLKANAEELRVTDYENLSIFCKFEDEYFTEEIAQEFLRLLDSVRSVSNSLSIDLRDNAFTDDHVKRIAAMIAKHKDLKELVLWLPDNYITDDGATELIATLDGLKSLRLFTLNLEWNFRVSNKSLQALTKRLPTLSQLKTLRVLISKFCY